MERVKNEALEVFNLLCQPQVITVLTFLAMFILIVAMNS